MIDTIQTIIHTRELEEICDKLRSRPYVAIDTEFMREQTYHPKLCLVQVANNEVAALIDPLSQTLSLEPLCRVLRDQSVVKVFHAARQDIEIFFKLMGEVPLPIFDTQIAAMVCGYGEQVSYDNLVNIVTTKNIDKSSRLMDWSRRPLTEPQLKYALGDVTHLRTVYEHLNSMLKENNRSDWIEDEMAILRNPVTYVTKPQEAYKRIKTLTRSRRYMGLLQEVAAWREHTAQTKNVPRSRILRDESLMEIAGHPPASADDLEKIRGIPKGWSKSEMGDTLMAAIRTGQSKSEENLPAVPKKKPSIPIRGLGPLVDLLKVLLKARCEDVGVAGKLVANVADLEEIAKGEQGKTVAALSGWRFDIFGRDALDLRAGRICLMYDRGQVITIRPNE